MYRQSIVPPPQIRKNPKQNKKNFRINKSNSLLYLSLLFPLFLPTTHFLHFFFPFPTIHSIPLLSLYFFPNLPFCFFPSFFTPTFSFFFSIYFLPTHFSLHFPLFLPSSEPFLSFLILSISSPFSPYLHVFPASFHHSPLFPSFSEFLVSQGSSRFLLKVFIKLLYM